MGVGAAIAMGVSSALSVGYSAYSRKSDKRRAEHERDSIEKKEEGRLREAAVLAGQKSDELRRRISLHGRQSTFSSFKESAGMKKSILGG